MGYSVPQLIQTLRKRADLEERILEGHADRMCEVIALMREAADLIESLNVAVQVAHKG